MLYYLKRSVPVGGTVPLGSLPRFAAPLLLAVVQIGALCDIALAQTPPAGPQGGEEPFALPAAFEPVEYRVRLREDRDLWQGLGARPARGEGFPI